MKHSGTMRKAALLRAGVTVCWYLLPAVSVLLALQLVTGIFNADLQLPLTYDQGDSFFTMTHLTALLRGEWQPFTGIRSEHLGAPWGFTMYDFPIPVNFLFILVKLCGWAAPNSFFAINLYYILTFVLTTVTFIWAARKFRISPELAIAFGLLYAFLPYHFFRGISHFRLASYFFVPPLVMILLWLWSAKPLFFRKTGGRRRLNITDKKTMTAIVVLLLAGSSGVYYSFFFSFFALVAGVSAARRRKSRHHLYAAVLAILVVSTAVVVNVAPSLMYSIKNGSNHHLTREPGDAERFGLKIAQLLLPVSGHRLGFLARLKSEYNATSPLVNENDSASLGIIGSCGFIILLLSLWRRDVFAKLGLLLLGALLLAGIGGFASLVSLLVTPLVRSYNRISVFIACFSFFGLCFLLQRYRAKLPPLLFAALLTALIGGGLFDQTTPYMVLTQRDRGEFLTDREFIGRIEQSVPPRSMIWQMPQTCFPEAPWREGMAGFSHLRGYLQSETLRWSYGIMYGRPAGAWSTLMAQLPLDELLERLAVIGFSGVYVDRNAYPDRAVALEAELQERLAVEPLVSRNDRLAFFSMVPYREELLNRSSPAAIEAMRTDYLSVFRRTD